MAARPPAPDIFFKNCRPRAITPVLGVLADIHARARSLWHSAGRPTVALRVGAAAALAGAAFVSVAASARSEPATPLPVAASGVFSTWNSHGGLPVLTAPDMRPGDEAEGEVRVKNTGEVNGQFTLLKNALVDPGARSSWLKLRVDYISSAGSSVPVYEGSLAVMPAATRLAGEFAPNEQRRYRFVVEFNPPSAPGGVLPTATTSVAFAWGADPVTPAAPRSRCASVRPRRSQERPS